MRGGCDYLDPEMVAAKWSHFALEQGDILLSTSASLGRTAQVTAHAVGAVPYTGLIRMRPRDARVLPEYVEIVLKDPSFQAQVEAMGAGSVMRHFGPSHLREMTVRVPPHDEQRRIAGVLGALDDKIEHNRSLAEGLTETSRQLFRAFRRGGWPTGVLHDICTTQYGFTASATEAPVGPKFLRVMDINKRPWIDWTAVPFCEIDSQSHERYRLAQGDIVVARMADPGKSAIVEDDVDAVFASYLVRLKAPSLAHAYFIYGYLQSPEYAEYAMGAMTGSVQKNMNARVIVGAPVPVPPEDELERHLSTVLPIRLRLSAAIRESGRLAAIRDALLPKLVSGKIRVPESYDPDDVLGTLAEQAATT